MLAKTLSLLAIFVVAGGLIACTEQPTGVVDGGERPDFKSANAANSFATNNFIDITGVTRFNVCTDEVIVASGRIHVQFHVTDTGEGIQISGHANLAGAAAVGEDTGLTYRLVGRSGQSFGQQVITPGGAVVVHFVLHQRWVSQGSAPDRVFVTGSHLTVNANGDVTSFHPFDTPGDCH